MNISDVHAQAQGAQLSPSPRSHVQSFEGHRARASGPDMQHIPIYLFTFHYFQVKKKKIRLEILLEVLILIFHVNKSK